MSAVAVIGGTGRLGFGLAVRWTRAGRAVIIGSRRADKAENAARKARALAGSGEITGMENRAAAGAAEVVVLTIPYAAQAAILADLRPAVRHKIVVDTTIPLRQYEPPLLEPVPAGSAAAQAQALLPEARVVAAFHTVSEVLVRRFERPLEGDVLICGADPEARAAAIPLAEAVGLRGFDAGDLSVAGTLEHLGALLIALNQRYRRRAIGIRLTGI